MGIIMTAKEKANELVVKFMQYVPADESMELPYAKQCALIAVQIVIDSNPLSPHDGSYYELTEDRVNTVIEYWQQVKIEIEAL